MWRVSLECGPVSAVRCSQHLTDHLTRLPVFSKCADSIEGGKRLENLSWRLWNRETFCCPAQPQYSITPSIDVLRPRPRRSEVPALSTSVESVSDDQSEQTSSSARSSSSDDSALSRSRGREKHITPLGLEKMVLSIKERTDLQPLSPSMAVNLPPISDVTPRPSSPSPQIAPMHSETSSQSQNLSDSSYSAVNVGSSRNSDHRGSDTSVSSSGLIKSGSIVHGFSPSPRSGSFHAKLISTLTTPLSQDSNDVHGSTNKTMGGIFTLGGSSGDDESSFEDRLSKHSKRGSLTDRFKLSEAASRPSSFKATSLSRQIRTIKEGRDEDEGAIESEDEEMDESAIEDEEDSDWEDSATESGKSSVLDDKPVFKRVDSHVNLISRKSLLTRGLHEPQRAAALAEAAIKSSSTLRRSRTSSPTGPSDPASPATNSEDGGQQRSSDITRSRPIICTTSNTHVPAHSPRTTRRNMLATELTESLRRHLLWERQQKSTTANAVFKRRHTAHNEMANLQEFPGPKPGLPLLEASKNNSWNHTFEYAPW